MKYTNVSDYSVKVGRLQGFGKLPSDFLDLVRRDLGLKMPLSVLTGLQNYFRINSCPDPDAAELVLFDILRENSEVRPDIFVSEVCTNDPVLAETYADMMQKFRALYPAHEGPVPLDMLFTLAGKYLSSCLPPKNCKNALLADRGAGRAGLLFEYAVSARKYSTENGNFEFYVTPCRDIKKKRQKNVIYYLISPISHISLAEKRSQYDRMLSERGLDTSVLSVIPVSDGCISAIIRDCPSAYVDMSHFVLSDADIPSAATVGQGDIILCVIPGSDSLLSEVAVRYGFKAIRIGERRKKGNFELRTSFVRSFRADLVTGLLTKKQSRKLSLTLPVTEDEEDCAPLLHKICEYADSHIISGDGKDTLCIGGESFRVLEAEYETSPYKKGRDMVLFAADDARRRGLRPSEIKLTLDVLAREDAPDKLFEFMLGVYRARIELCIPSEGDRLEIKEDGTLSAIALVRMPTGREIGDETGSGIGDETESGIGDETESGIAGETENEIGGETERVIGDETGSEISDEKTVNVGRACHICIPILGGTGEINSFIRLARENGAECAAPFFGTSFTDGEAALLGRLLSETDILILDGSDCDEEFFKGRRTDALVSSFISRGGVVFAVGRAAVLFPETNGVYRREKGISREEFAQLIHI